MAKKKSSFLDQKKRPANDSSRDFSTRRAKVGRKVARTADVTKTDFTAKSVKLGEQVSSSHEGEKRSMTSWLTQLGSHNEYARRTGCEGIGATFKGEENYELTVRIMQLLSRLSVEESRSVRKAAFSALRTVIRHGNTEAVLQTIRTSLAARLGAGFASLDRSCRLDTAALAKWLLLEAQLPTVRIAIAQVGELFLGPLATALKTAKSSYLTTLLTVAAVVLTSSRSSTTFSLSPEYDFFFLPGLETKTRQNQPLTTRPFLSSFKNRAINTKTSDRFLATFGDGARAVMQQVAELCLNPTEENDEALGSMARRLVERNDAVGEYARSARQALSAAPLQNSPSVLAAQIDEHGLSALDAVLAAQISRKARSFLSQRILVQEVLGRLEAQRLLSAFEHEPTLLLALAQNQSQHRPGDHCWWLEPLLASLSSPPEDSMATQVLALSAAAARRSRSGGPSSKTLIALLPSLVKIASSRSSIHLASVFYYLAPEEKIETALNLIRDLKVAITVGQALALSARPSLAIDLLTRLAPAIHSDDHWTDFVYGIQVAVLPEHSDSLLALVNTLPMQRRLTAALAFTRDERFFYCDAVAEALAADETSSSFDSDEFSATCASLLHRLATNQTCLLAFLQFLRDSTETTRKSNLSLLATARLLREKYFRTHSEVYSCASWLCSVYSNEIDEGQQSSSVPFSSLSAEEDRRRHLVSRIRAFLDIQQEIFLCKST